METGTVPRRKPVVAQPGTIKEEKGRQTPSQAKKAGRSEYMPPEVKTDIFDDTTVEIRSSRSSSVSDHALDLTIRQMERTEQKGKEALTTAAVTVSDPQAGGQEQYIQLEDSEEENLGFLDKNAASTRQQYIDMQPAVKTMKVNSKLLKVTSPAIAHGVETLKRRSQYQKEAAAKCRVGQEMIAELVQKVKEDRPATEIRDVQEKIERFQLHYREFVNSVDIFMKGNNYQQAAQNVVQLYNIFRHEQADMEGHMTRYYNERAAQKPSAKSERENYGNPQMNSTLREQDLTSDEEDLNLVDPFATANDNWDKYMATERQKQPEHECKHQCTPRSHSPRRQLERLQLDVYEGKEGTYESWKEEFNAIVGDSKSMQVEEKRQRLLAKVSKEIRRPLQLLPNTAEGYEKMWALLDFRHGGDARQTHAIHKEIHAIPSGGSTPKHLWRIHDGIHLIMARLKFRDEKQDSASPMLLQIKTKLSQGFLIDYHKWLPTMTDSRDHLENLEKWVQIQAMATEAAQQESSFDGKPGHKDKDKDKRPPSTRAYAGTLEETPVKENPNERKMTCYVCHEPDHCAYKCPRFKLKTPEERYAIVKKAQLCVRCLGKYHGKEKCRFQRTCGICDMRNHHTILHLDKAIGTTSKAMLMPPKQPTPTTNSYHSLAGPGPSLQLIPVLAKLTKNGCYQRLVGMLDSGTQVTFLSAKGAKKLGIDLSQLPKETINLGTILKTQLMETSFINLSLKSEMDDNFEMNIRVASMADLPKMVLPKLGRLKKRYDYLKDIPFPDLPGAHVDIMFGLDVYAQVARVLDARYGDQGEPAAIKTPFGWTVFGPNTIEKDDPTVTIQSNFCCNIGKLYEGDKAILDTKPGEMSAWSPEEKYVQQIFTDEKEIVNGKIVLPIPWNKKKPLLQNNYNPVLERQRKTEETMTKKGTHATYVEKVEDSIKKGYFTEVEDPEPTNGNEKHYINTFPVWTESSTTPCRVVFDCSSKHRGLSLNDAIFPGPNLQEPMAGILTQARLGQDALAGDISEMFPQLKMKEADKSYFRILHRKSPKEKMKIFESQSIVFGATCSPAGAQFVVLETANIYQEQLPLAAKAIKTARYVDDIITTYKGAQEGKKVYEELKTLFGHCGMQIRKFASNNPEVMGYIPQEERVNKAADGQMPATTILGLMWYLCSDELGIKPVEVSQITTKRELLSALAQIFDPLGLLAPWLIQSRHLLQKLWLTGKEWDSAVPEELQNSVDKWASNIRLIKDIRVPRNILTEGVPTAHFFCDASGLGYAAMCYIQVTRPDGSRQANLLCSKARVAPLKTVSIPKLELAGAVLATQLYQALKPTLKTMEVQFWTDSTNVLHWIKQESRKYSVYVANRIATIQTVTDPGIWNHIEGERNPADIPSRGSTLEDLKDNQFYWYGPDFLNDPEAEMPKQTVHKIEDDPELLKKTIEELFCGYVRPINRPDFEPFETLGELVQAVAVLIRQERGDPGLPDRNDRSLALQEVIRIAQGEAFPEEVDALLDGRNVKRSSKLIKLCPFMDLENIIRCHTRLVFATTIADSTKRPIILPRKHKVTSLIILEMHELTDHAYGKDYTLAKVRETYWVLKAGQAVSEAIRKCRRCMEVRNLPAGQIQAPLRSIRTDLPLKAFWKVCVDFAGPYWVKVGRGMARAKRFLCLFTCPQTRAVHLELAMGSSTGDFLNCLQRFTSRRGRFTDLYSDNGTNFHGAETELRRLVQDLDHEQLDQYAENGKFQFHFNPAHAPHMGALFESMIKSSKRAIRAVLRDQDVTDNELSTIFSGAEDILNSRPLTFQNNDPNDFTVLTPAMFLHGRMDGVVFPPGTEVLDYNPRQRWRMVQDCLGQIWSRWLREILPTLGPRQKWFQDQRNFEVGDEVLVMAPNVQRYKWKPGRVTAVHPGRDGRVRIVEVHTQDGALERPVHRLIPLT
jgi:hypothetical protein